jgi:hypothetical protein
MRSLQQCLAVSRCTEIQLRLRNSSQMFAAPITANLLLGIAHSQQRLLTWAWQRPVSNEPRNKKGEEESNRIHSRGETKNARRPTPQSHTGRCLRGISRNVERSTSRVLHCHQSINENPRRISPTRVPFNFSLSDYFLQHLPGQHFALPLQQSAAGDVAVAVLMNAANVAIKRRYFI